MIAKREIRNYTQSVKVWTGKYRNSHNLLHWHYDCELVYVEHGSVDIFCEKRLHRLNTGDALFIDSGQIHYQRALERDTVLALIIFDYNILKPYFENVCLLSPQLSKNYSIPEAYRRIRSVLTEKNEFYGAEAAGEVIELMVKIFRGETVMQRSDADKAETFKRLLEEVGEHCGEYSFARAASFMGMSEAYFSRYFHAAAGITFSQYLNYARTSKAVQLIQRGAGSMTEISDLCGFGTIRNFNRIFKQLTGFAPLKLPDGFVLDEKFIYPSDESFNPTLYDCELIEGV